MNITRLAAFAALPLLAACAPQVEADVTISTIKSVGDTAVPATGPVTLLVPQAGDDGCKQQIRSLEATLATVMPITAEGVCIQHEGESYAQLRTTITLIQSETDRPETGLFVLEVRPDRADDGAASFGLTLVQMRTLEELVTLVNGSSSGTAGFDDHPTFKLNLINDTEATTEAYFDHVFVDGHPRMRDAGPEVMAPDAIARIQFSDVTASVLALSNGYEFATIYPDVN